jgi:hypothetical protein
MAGLLPDDPPALADDDAARSAQPEAIAHDFNNILGSMMGWIHLARRQANDPAVDALLERALAAGERGKVLTARLLRGGGE